MQLLNLRNDSTHCLLPFFVPIGVTALQAARPLPCTTFSARAVYGMRCHLAAHRFGSRDLHPPVMGIELLRVTTAQHFERPDGMAFQVDFCLCMLVPKPVWRYKVSDEYFADFVTVLIIFDRICNFAGLEDAMEILIGTVQPWIHSHLA